MDERTLSAPSAMSEIAADTRARLQMLGGGILLFSLGVLSGLWLAPDTPREAARRENALTSQLGEREAKVLELEQALRAPTHDGQAGALLGGDRLRHEHEGKRVAHALKRMAGRGASDLMLWFVRRWDQILDQPQPSDRVERRAAALALLIGGMASHVDPADYVPWQAEFLGGGWLGELHIDLDQDGLPGSQKTPNTHDNFINVSVCQIAMALNQAVRDCQILMMPEMRCDRPDSKMSVFLQGESFGDAITSFVRALREEHFLVVERQERGVRLVLVGARPAKAPRDDD